MNNFFSVCKIYWFSKKETVPFCNSNYVFLYFSPAENIIRRISQSGIDPFTSSRSSVKSLTESIALQLADKGIRVNAIAPGVIDSDVINELLEDKEQMKQVVRTIPFHRTGKAGEIAKVALFLASKASSYVTGT